MKCKQESEIFLFKILLILSKNNYDKIKPEHIHSIQLNSNLKNNQIEQTISFHIKNNFEDLNSNTIKFKVFKIYSSHTYQFFSFLLFYSF